jgi:uncharacterized protein involved in exopolysaccharide biosynthesis
MSKSSELSNPRLDHLLHTLIERRKLWLIPGCAALLLSWIYVYFISSESYTARQTLIVRDDLLGQSLKPGQFESLDLMKSAQETILEIARKPQVVRNAMRKIGPARAGWFGVSDSWPDDKTIETVQGSIKLSAPNGAEFGHTETVVLSTKSDSRVRAAEFVVALLDEINIKINEVRDLRLRSMTNELTLIRDSAQRSLAESAERLSAMEREIGADLPTLRSLSDPQSGEGSMSQTLLQIRSERRQFENRLHSAENQRATLVNATHDPNAILATSDELFSFQPALSRLKQELIEAQSALAESVGRYENAHPTVQKHQEQVRSMHRQIHNELDSAMRGLKGQIASLRQKVNKSLAQEAEIDSRFNRISSKRVDYLRLDEEVKKKTEVFNESQSNLASIQRLDSQNFDVTLLTPVDEPQVSTRADGLGAKTTILGSGLAGLLAGFGLILLLDPGPEARQSALANSNTAPQSPNRTSAPPVTNPVGRTPAAQTPVAQTPVAQAPVAQTPVAQAPVAQAPVAPALRATTEVPADPRRSATSAPFAVNNAVDSPTPIQASAPAPIAKTQTPPARPITEPQPPTPQPSASPAAAAPVTRDRSNDIQAEIDRAVARGGGKTSNPAMEVKPMTASAQVANQPSSKPLPPTMAQPSPLNAQANELNQAADPERKQSDSTGVPTAASILAAMEKTGSSNSPITPVISSPPSPQMNPPVSTQGTQQQEIELQRRAVKPVDSTNQPVDSATPFVSLEPNDSDASASSRAVNPFLNPRQTGDEGPAATARRMLEEAKAEAEQQGMVAPVVPVKPDAETMNASRVPASTIPIPDQIKQLTDSIASFAKPINRFQDPGSAANP